MTIELAQREPQLIEGVREVVPMSSLSEFFGRAFGTTAEVLARQGATPKGPPVALYRGPAKDTVDVLAGFPLARPANPEGGVVLETLPGGATVEAVHTGPYDTLSATYGELSDWFTEQCMETPLEMWEEYLVGPETEPDPQRWQTRIVFPLT